MEELLEEAIKNEVVRNIAYQLDFRYPDEPEEKHILIVTLRREGHPRWH